MDTHSSMPVRAAFQRAGLSPGPVDAASRRWPGTLAQVNPESLRLLSLQEQEPLQTRATVPYRDPTLSASGKAIRQRRQQEAADYTNIALAQAVAGPRLKEPFPRQAVGPLC